MKRTYSLAAVALLLRMSAAHAQSTEAEKRTAAEAIYTQASDLMARNDFTAACPKLEEVVQLQPNGIGAKLSLAECYARAGKLASAHAMYGQAASMSSLAGQQDRAAAAQEKGNALAPRLSRLTLAIRPEIASLPGLKVMRDGAAVTPSLFNVAVAIDGGSHTVVVSAPGRKPFTQSVSVAREGAMLSVNVALLSETNGGLGAPRPAPDPGERPRANSPEESGMQPIRIAGIVVGSVGLAVAGAGIGLGVTGDQKTRDSKAANEAATTRAERERTQEDNDAGFTQLTAGWALTAVGGAALVAGVIMVIAAPDPDSAPGASARVSLWALPTGTGVLVGGHW